MQFNIRLIFKIIDRWFKVKLGSLCPLRFDVVLCSTPSNATRPSKLCVKFNLTWYKTKKPNKV